jgi:hypothetical protein
VDSYEKIKKIPLGISLIVIAAFIITCAIRVDEHRGENIMTQKTMERVLKEHTNELMSVPGVVGTAQGLCNDKPCIKVYVIEKTPDLGKKIPDFLEGYPVMIEETGEFRALPKNQTQK